MLKQILELLAAVAGDPHLAPYKSRLEAAKQALEAKTGSAEADAKALVEQIEQARAASSQDAKQASFNAISAAIGHTPVGTAPSSATAGPGKPAAPKKAGIGPQVLTKPELALEQRRRKIDEQLREYNLKAQVFAKAGEASARRAVAAYEAFGRVKAELDARKKEFDPVRIATPDPDKDPASGKYGAAYQAYEQTIERCATAAGEMVDAAERARLEVEALKDARGPADTLFDDFLVFDKNASRLADAERWIARQNVGDDVVWKVIKPLKEDIAKLLGPTRCSTTEKLREAIAARMQAARSARATDADAAMLAAQDASMLDKAIVEVERRVMFAKDQLEGKEAQERRRKLDEKYLQGDNLKPGVVAADVAAVGKGSTAELRRTFDDLRHGRSSLTGEQIRQLYGEIVDKVLRDKTMLAAISNDVDLCGDLIMMAEKEGKLDDAVLQGLGNNKSAVATRVLLEKTKSGAPGDGRAASWMWDAVALEDWNAKDKGVSAQVYNALWNSGDYDRICTLVTKGANAGQAHSLGQDTGRGSGKKEGIWSGFIQPMEHLLGNYVRKVHELEKNKGAFTGEELKKVQGAQKVLKALEGLGAQCHIVTDYKEIVDSDAIKAFNEKPGTIWGFEDVRLPYVQAARENDKDDKHKGNQPLRMWELWKAVEKALNQAGYEELLQNPDAAIPKFVEEGRKAVVLEIRDSHAYPNLDVDEFLKEFKLQATAYLEHVAARIPKGEFDTAELSGMDPGKLMGGLGCKAGLWWAKESGKPVYYMMDGININEATDYKAWKNARIKANLEEGGSKHFEVITFAEIREILKNWTDLRETVVFIEKGSKLPESKVLEWRAKMIDNDQAAGKRPAPPPERFKDKLQALGGNVWTQAQADPHDAMKITVKADTLIRIAKMAKKDVLPTYLDQKAELLVTYGVIPRELAAASRKVMQVPKEELLAAKVGFESWAAKAAPNLIEPLSKWAATARA